MGNKLHGVSRRWPSNSSPSGSCAHIPRAPRSSENAPLRANNHISRFILDGQEKSMHGFILYTVLPQRSFCMDIGHRITSLREQKKLSQGDIEKRTGLLRCYISRVENGHTVPAIETLEKIARAYEVPLYRLFYEGEEPPQVPALLKQKSSDEGAWGSSGKDSLYLRNLRRALGKSNEQDRKLI